MKLADYSGSMSQDWGKGWGPERGWAGCKVEREGFDSQIHLQISTNVITFRLTSPEAHDRIARYPR